MNQVVKYFEAERQESLLFIVVGVLAFVLAIVLLLRNTSPYYHGMAFSFMLVALIQLVVGTSVYIRSPKDIQRVEKIILQQKEKINTEEIPRMKMVMKNFVVYRWVEIALIIAGVLSYLFFKSGSLWSGLGMGIVIQASIMLALDFFAEQRGRAYINYLSTLNHS